MSILSSLLITDTFDDANKPEEENILEQGFSRTLLIKSFKKKTN